ncbi:MAG TPA: hypothetical protein VMQ45_09585 [Burkholderiaceae bacterium]|jgi:hypothetical protein|nr:hypothetical protein [Burkholderiaceae bacterium]
MGSRDRVVTYGDSIKWGHGVPEPFKFRTLVTQRLQGLLPQRRDPGRLRRGGQRRRISVGQAADQHTLTRSSCGESFSP